MQYCNEMRCGQFFVSTNDLQGDFLL
jgi:hypothetical protein